MKSKRHNLRNICTVHAGTIWTAELFSIFMRAAADSLFYYIPSRLPIVHPLAEFISHVHRNFSTRKYYANSTYILIDTVRKKATRVSTARLTSLESAMKFTSFSPGKLLPAISRKLPCRGYPASRRLALD